MTLARLLIAEGKFFLIKNPPSLSATTHIRWRNVFGDGAAWMLLQLNALDGKQRVLNPQTPFNLYGFAKYASSLLVFGIAVFLLSQIHLLFVLFAVWVFYAVEVLFLFLFPLLLDGAENPIRDSVKLTFRIGIFSAISTVLPIGVFMVLGFLRLRSPLKNWAIGCVAVLIWYKQVTQ